MLVFMVDLTWALRSRFFSPCSAFFMADLFFFNNPSRSILVFLPCLLPASQFSFYSLSQPTSEMPDEGMVHKRTDQLAVPVEGCFFVDEIQGAVP